MHKQEKQDELRVLQGGQEGNEMNRKRNKIRWAALRGREERNEMNKTETR